MISLYHIDVCLTLPCGVNANCQATNDGYSCSCPKGMTGDPKVKCEGIYKDIQISNPLII